MLTASVITNIDKNNQNTINDFFMDIALNEAKKGIGFTSPNPLVGAVIVKNNKILSTGFHKRDGQAHAEVIAIKKLSEKKVKDSDLYVNLEPCSHYGRTPPCTDLIIKSKIKRVFIANKDIDNRVNGKGIEILKKAGISVKTHIMEKKGKNLNSIYFFNKKNNRPYIVIKAAVTLDGKIASFIGDSKWISNEKSRQIVHKLRLRLKSIAIGHNTVIKDKPQLNCRLKGFEKKPIDKLVFTEKNTEKFRFAENSGNIYIINRWLSSDKKNFIDFCNEKKIDSVLVEGGSHVYSWFLNNDLVDRIFLFYKPAFLGNDGIPLILERKINHIKNLSDFKINDVKLMDDNFMVDLARGEALCLLV
ncbi:MAG: bifunctional diaminohydroxyphosphoribosylaminopyrimidine deaminase/5-amino-6-(5-phosphoribosylamino)uracil reductase RibD [Spirochaetes bacterium]|nr:bifunctional diaminohydroxyphosphoribosylaminopyrimidine deaminase/5-amino-6-(5-phosphoribosylamino)uracil reductase RibD [Spirochaetota bacterium]